MSGDRFALFLLPDGSNVAVRSFFSRISAAEFFRDMAVDGADKCCGLVVAVGVVVAAAAVAPNGLVRMERFEPRGV